LKKRQLSDKYINYYSKQLIKEIVKKVNNHFVTYGKKVKRVKRSYKQIYRIKYINYCSKQLIKEIVKKVNNQFACLCKKGRKGRKGHSGEPPQALPTVFLCTGYASP